MQDRKKDKIIQYVESVDTKNNKVYNYMKEKCVMYAGEGWGKNEKSTDYSRIEQHG